MHLSHPRKRFCTRLRAISLAGLALLAAPGVLHAQAIVMAGSYQNFDVLNNTGAPTYGFEMEVYGVSSSQCSDLRPDDSEGYVRAGHLQ